MPVYDYMCEDCGPFTQMHPMSVCADPQACPDCGLLAPRAFLSAPYFAGMDSARRSAIATNERSANAPMTSSEFAAKKHGAGCSCCSGMQSRSKKSRTATAPSGAKSFPSARPWMISH
ncbi:zinc ribbon domain-containing protein [Azorhizobium caulinodans]|uniref:FmdB family zinc ribbon protein n=1 Tax=Azorhizobium caulinodans TaxID=7 RepID=UPI002FBDE41D